MNALSYDLDPFLQISIKLKILALKMCLKGYFNNSLLKKTRKIDAFAQINFIIINF